MKKPNFFICGSPKAGTTSVYNHLKEHPEIFMSEKKEPNYFAKDIHKKSKYKKEDYIRLFQDANKEKIIGEASTSYFVSDNAPKEIKKFNSKAKILIMTRDKFEVLYSFFYQRVHGGTAENISNFEKWFHERLVKKNSNFPVWKLLEQEKQIEKYRKMFGKNLLVIKLEDYKENPEKEYKKILDFLEVKNKEFKPDFKKYNTSKKYKSEVIRKIYYFLAKLNLHKIIPEKTRKYFGGKLKKENK